MVLVSTFFTTFFCNNQSVYLHFTGGVRHSRTGLIASACKTNSQEIMHACTSCIFITLIEPLLFTDSSLQPHQSSAQHAMTDCFCCSVAAETNYTTLIYRHLDCSVDEYSFSSFAFEIRIIAVQCILPSTVDIRG